MTALLYKDVNGGLRPASGNTNILLDYRETWRSTPYTESKRGFPLSIPYTTYSIYIKYVKKIIKRVQRIQFHQTHVSRQT